MSVHTRFSKVQSRVKQITWVFAENRLMDRKVLEWAADLTPQQSMERDAIRQLFDQSRANIKMPYIEAWQWIFEYWDRPEEKNNYLSFILNNKLKSRESHADAIRLIVSAVRPWVRVGRLTSPVAPHKNNLRKNPKSVKDLLWLSITSGKQLTPEIIGLNQITDIDLLIELAHSLNTALLSGLRNAHRIGLITEDIDQTNWQVHRVYFVPPEQYGEGGNEPDKHAEGFAPCTKLLSSVVEKLAELYLPAAQRIVASWDHTRWKLHKRLWASASRNCKIADAESVGSFLLVLNAKEFWSISSYPEFAELRAIRWKDFDSKTRNKLERRLLRGQPRYLLPSYRNVAEVNHAAQHRIFAELSRIKIAGGNLSVQSQAWLAEAGDRIDNLPIVDSVTYGFNPSARVLREEIPKGDHYHNIDRLQLLATLEQDINDRGWSDKMWKASEFIGQNADLVLELLGKTPNDDEDYPRIWETFGYYFLPSNQNTGSSEIPAAERSAALKACILIENLSGETIRSAIGGFSSWIANWGRVLNGTDKFLRMWLRLWPIAAEETNREPDISKTLEERSIASPIGQLTLGFLRAHPRWPPGSDRCVIEPWARVFHVIEETGGEAILIARYQLMADVRYLFAVRSDWVTKNILLPLRSANGESIELWTAFAQSGYQEKNVIALIKPELVAAVMNPILSENTRGALSERITWRAILDQKDGTEPAIDSNTIQQMLRIGGDMVRIHAIKALKDYMEFNNETFGGMEDRFELIVKPLFNATWPKEITLVSRKVSAALAEFPAAASSKFAEAVTLVLRYLTPFDCWWLGDYGLYELSGNEGQIQHVESVEDANALLALLEETIGGEEGAIVPYDLDKGLQHIRYKAPKLEADIRFQRLLTLSRRH